MNRTVENWLYGAGGAALLLACAAAVAWLHYLEQSFLVCAISLVLVGVLGLLAGVVVGKGKGLRASAPLKDPSHELHIK